MLKISLENHQFAEDDVTLDGDATIEFVASRIFAADNAELFYKVVGGSKKGRVYGLRSEAVLMAATQSKSFVPPQVQPNVDEIVVAPSFRKALDELLNERDCQSVDRQHEARQQMI